MVVDAYVTKCVDPDAKAAELCHVTKYIELTSDQLKTNLTDYTSGM